MNHKLPPDRADQEPYIVGRYAIYGEIASGGMATVHLGRLFGEAGFSRTVAIKRLHPQFAKDPEFVSMLTDEARIAARIRHPNVVSTVDVVSSCGELLLVMDYVHGESLARLIRIASTTEGFVPLAVTCGIVSQALLGLHAAHEATSERGIPLAIVHRDISPQNIMVGADGVSQVLDFGVAKAALRASTTKEGEIKGKISYMAPEQFFGGEVDRRVDVFACGVVLWEALCSRRLFSGDDVAATLGRIASGNVEPPSRYRDEVSPELDQLVLKALAVDPDDRFQSALEFADAIENTCPMASRREIGAWVAAHAEDDLQARKEHVSLAEITDLGDALPSEDRISWSDAGSVATVKGPKPQARSSGVRAVALLVGAALLVLSGSLLRQVTRPRAEPLPQVAEQVPGAQGQGAQPVQIPAEQASASPASPAAASMAGVAPQPGAGAQLPAAQPAAAQPAAAQPAAHRASTPAAQAVASASAPPAAPPPALEPSQPAPARVSPNVSLCDPPYSIDAHGIKRVKPGCL